MLLDRCVSDSLLNVELLTFNRLVHLSVKTNPSRRQTAIKKFSKNALTEVERVRETERVRFLHSSPQVLDDPESGRKRRISTDKILQRPVVRLTGVRTLLQIVHDHVLLQKRVQSNIPKML